MAIAALIRPMTEEDIPAVAALLEALAHEHIVREFAPEARDLFLSKNNADSSRPSIRRTCESIRSMDERRPSAIGATPRRGARNPRTFATRRSTAGRRRKFCAKPPRTHAKLRRSSARRPKKRARRLWSNARCSERCERLWPPSRAPGADAVRRSPVVPRRQPLDRQLRRRHAPEEPRSLTRACLLQ
jgi:hypothetical protein